MRKNVCVEGQEYPGGVILAPGSVYIEESEVPVFVHYGPDCHIVGSARAVHRDIDTGTVSMDFQLGEDCEELLANYTATLGITEALEARNLNDTKTIINAALVGAVHLTYS